MEAAKNQTDSWEEKRVSTRYPCDIDGFNKQLIRNLSREGAYLDTDKNYQLNQELSLDFVLPTEADSVKVQGRIVRRIERDGDRRGYGVQFQGLDKELQRRLDGYFVTNQEVFGKLEEVFQEVLSDNDDVDFHREASIINDLSIDSLKVAELSILLEQKFEQSFFLSDWFTCKDDPQELTVASLVDYVTKKTRTVH